jgi:hypothetical protein
MYVPNKAYSLVLQAFIVYCQLYLHCLPFNTNWFAGLLIPLGRHASLVHFMMTNWNIAELWLYIKTIHIDLKLLSIFCLRL